MMRVGSSMDWVDLWWLGNKNGTTPVVIFGSFLWEDCRVQGRNQGQNRVGIGSESGPESGPESGRNRVKTWFWPKKHPTGKIWDLISTWMWTSGEFPGLIWTWFEPQKRGHEREWGPVHRPSFGTSFPGHLPPWGPSTTAVRASFTKIAYKSITWPPLFHAVCFFSNIFFFLQGEWDFSKKTKF